MSFEAWLEDTKVRFREQPIKRAAFVSAMKLWQGGFRRTLDSYIGTPIWEMGDWDICLVLDGCRVDLLREIADEYSWLPSASKIASVRSIASCSEDWIPRTFDPAICPSNVGYISANPFTGHDSPTHDTLPLDESEFSLLDEVWREEWKLSDEYGIKTTDPKVLTDHSIAAWRQRQELDIDKLIVHYMQPHEPFRTRPEWCADVATFADLVTDSNKKAVSQWRELEKGNRDFEEVWTAYRDNLRWVLDDISRLLSNTDSNVLITADHGNATGEWYTFGHPPATLCPTARRVPMITVSAIDKQTEDVDVEFVTKRSPADENLQDQLSALGYSD